ncbi:MAG: AsmA family protein, partial [Rubrivivax sp.]|nr:AsmA family protein [Rubrivivax sp.]
PVATPARAAGKVLPQRPFDLAALRAMDADVVVDIREVDLDTALLEPLRPLRARLRLAAGVLTLSEIDARLGQGQLLGKLALDGTGSTALWTADLHWDGVRVERWINQRSAEQSPPFVTGRLKGHTTLAGQGRSTADILASLQGLARIEMHEAAVSHLALEVAGLDLAQGLGVMLKGDNMLPVQCAMADLVAQAGVVRPRVMVLDTTDSTVWVEGTLSLASETIDLRAVVSPKDFSPLALRTPLRVRGRLLDPAVSFEKGPMGRKLATAFLLALVNPLAALIPLIDTGDTEAARRGAAGCLELAQRSVAKR